METLCRVTGNGYWIDRKGYLLTHATEYEFALYDPLKSRPSNPEPRILKREIELWLPLQDTHNRRRVSLVNPVEWESVARFLTLTRPACGPFRLLTIDKSKIERLENEPHPALIEGEYWGEIPPGAVLKDEGYRWVENGGKTNMTLDGRKFINERLPLEASERLEQYGLEKIK
jgi:hypothetical protein